MVELAVLRAENEGLDLVRFENKDGAGLAELRIANAHVALYGVVDFDATVRAGCCSSISTSRKGRAGWDEKNHCSLRSLAKF